MDLNGHRVWDMTLLLLSLICTAVTGVSYYIGYRLEKSRKNLGKQNLEPLFDYQFLRIPRKSKCQRMLGYLSRVLILKTKDKFKEPTYMMSKSKKVS